MTGQALDDLARRVMLDVARLEYGGLMEEASEHDFSPEFERKMKKLSRQADHPVRHRWLRAAQLAAVLAALLMMVTIATAAAGYDIWRMLARWTAEVITLAPGQIQYAGQDDIHIPEEPEEYANIQEALDGLRLRPPRGSQMAAGGIHAGRADRRLLYCRRIHRLSRRV